ncbi:hypothetical protein HAX54_014852 [Datura stramonium]|uniref:Uncharacterized protein n=1 Tax=Datura stramonium TaxID=4076 RepID=A0ABS8TNZ0_DATST|nr:hypothetical protein [Datura stramonium]
MLDSIKSKWNSSDSYSLTLLYPLTRYSLKDLFVVSLEETIEQTLEKPLLAKVLEKPLIRKWHSSDSYSLALLYPLTRYSLKNLFVVSLEETIEQTLEKPLLVKALEKPLIL